MQRLLEISQEVINRNFRLRAGECNREGVSKTALFTHPPSEAPAPLAGISISQQSLLLYVQLCSSIAYISQYPSEQQKKCWLSLHQPMLVYSAGRTILPSCVMIPSL